MKRFLAVSLMMASCLTLTVASGNREKEAGEEKPVLTHFIRISERASGQIQTNKEMYLYQALEEKFGFDMEFLHPPTGQEKEQFNLMLASGDLPDIITYEFFKVDGGPAKLLNDGALVSLDEYYNNGQLPHLKAFYDKNPEVMKQALTNEGHHFMFPFARPDLNNRINGGPMIRYDWLEKAGLEYPENMADWYEALTYFKNHDMNGNGTADDEVPFYSDKNNRTLYNLFPMAWKVTKGFCLAEGRVVFGPSESGYRNFLKEMSKWYSEGLIDQDYITNDNKVRDALMTTDRLGAQFGYMNGDVGKFNTIMKDHPAFDLKGIPWPVAADGVSYAGNKSWVEFVTDGGSAISGSNNNIELTLKVLDYAYSEEGNRMYNFGEEGKTFTMENGHPVFTDYILNNQDGLSATNALAKFAHSSSGISAGFAQDSSYASQIRASISQQLYSEKIWGESTGGILLPPLSPSSEESARASRILSEVNTYVDEYSNRVIMGLDSVDNFDKYVKELKRMGIEEAVEIMQRSYENFQNR